MNRSASLERFTQGFTLVETLIYVAIIGGLVVSLASFALVISSGRAKAYATSEVQANARLAIEAIAARVRQSTEVDVSASSFGVDPGVLALRAETGGDLTVIALDADDGTLTIAEGVAAPVAVTSQRVRVTNLVFQNLTDESDRESVGIDLTVSYLAAGDANFTFSQQLRASVSTRR